MHCCASLLNKGEESTVCADQKGMNDKKGAKTISEGNEGTREWVVCAQQ